MTSSINHEQEYQQAQKAYIQGNYEEAATIVDRLVQGFPDDPNSRLLRGHIYCVLRQYEIAREQYQVVMNLTDDLELIDCANNGLDSVNQYENADQIASNTTHALGVEDTFLIAGDSSERFDYGVKAEQQHSENLNQLESLNTNNFDSFNHDVEPADKSEQPFGSFFEEARESSKNYNSSGESSGFVDPFNLNQTHSTQSPDATHYEDLLDESSSSTDAFESSDNHHSFNEVYGSLNGSFEEVPDYNSHNYSDNNSNFSLPADDSLQSFESGSSPDRARENESSSIPFTQSSPTDSFEVAQQKLTSSPHSNGFHYQDSYNLDTFDPGLDEPAADAFLENANYQDEVAQSSINFIDEFDVGNTEFELPPSSQLSDSGPLSSSLATNWTNEGDRHSEENSLPSAGLAADLSLDNSNNKKNNTRKNWLATFENASLAKKQWLTASTVGVTSALVVAAISIGGGLLFPSKDTKAAVRETGLGLAMTVAAGIAGFATTRYLGRLTLNQLQQTTMDLRTQFNAVREGNLSAQATVYSDDEFGLLASEFNDMLRGISKNTLETQRKAEEQEHAKEELQRQVIRLLDDVEGAARGDLTVQAEVTADVLGAVADSFNLTIQSLREIVQQVKLAARQVSQGAADSETFARVLSSDALRQAEELAVSLNSVQVLTDAIQRVAETAREAETVARSASATAQKGGEAVERTVAGILEIRQTVAETTRKVKRLAESSQEISKIVALISQIASRTNMLALNASIEAARAGESGRGFAIVADEVRQLADRVAKALKEIEQIVRQIQSETGSVMTAMEEGTQQVIEGTKLAEQAKRSLEDIVQVSNHIDALVGSITADTVQQTETSRAVAVVVQSVELTAQETSQEAQRVSNSLHSLAGVAGNLLNSVERFRV